MRARRVRWSAWALALSGLLAAAPPARADALARVQQRGTLVVGVARDAPLWGRRDPASGRLVGLEPDLAADLARRVGVKLVLVGLLSAERVDALRRGRVDLLIATLSDTPERRAVLDLVKPHYYASGSNVMARRELGLHRWSDLRERRVCGRRGVFHNRAVTVEQGVDVIALYSNELSLAALRDGRCDAVLYDDTHIVALLQDPRWARDFEMPLPTLYVTPWSIALPREEAGGALEARVSQAIVDWHRSGRLLALERHWGIPASAFTQGMNRLWNRRGARGFFCGEQVTQATPAECL